MERIAAGQATTVTLPLMLPETPLEAYMLAECIQKAGLPEGVFNLVHGFGPEAGQALVEHPEVDGVRLTSSATYDLVKSVKAARYQILS